MKSTVRQKKVLAVVAVIVDRVLVEGYCSIASCSS